MTIGVLGAGAFGTALAIALSHNDTVLLWGRDGARMAEMQDVRRNTKHLPDCPFPEGVRTASDLQSLAGCEVLLVAVPMQKLRAFLIDAGNFLTGKTLIACCKGIELKSGLGPLEVMAAVCPEVRTALLTGPSFARDIAKSLPTALTLACSDDTLGQTMQMRLSTPTLRLYRTRDVTGAALGGALKNVIAIACGAAMGAGLGESARAALMTRGNAEMQRLAAQKGADPATLSGLSGFGDLVLTCTSEMSRNYRFGLALGTGSQFDPQTTVEGAATARALAQTAQQTGIEMPISSAVAALVENRLDVTEAMAELLSRSLKEE